MANYYNTIFNPTAPANGTSAEDTLIFDYRVIQSVWWPQGVYLGDQDVKNRANNATIFTFSSIELFDVYGTNNNDILMGSNYDRDAGYAANPYDDDILRGEDGDDYIDGRGGDDLLTGGNGNDTLIGGTGQDEIHGGSGNDKLYGDAEDWLDDTSGINQFYANEAAKITASTQTTLHANYSSYGGNGIHLRYFNGGGRIDNGMGGVLNFDGGLSFDIQGSQHDDVIGDDFNLTGNDFLSGNGGNDYINGGNGDDGLLGGAGNDTLIGGTGKDKLHGDDGDDLLIDTNGSIYGDSGFDTLIADYTNLSYNGGGVIVNPSGGNQFVFHNDIESFNIKGTKFIDNLVGGVNNDTLDGGLGDDSLDGGAGADQLLAIYGSDTVKGDNGDDVIYAVAGIDGATKQLYGGDGADRYILDVRGQVTLGFDFNTTTLANFVNAITLPENTGTDWQQLGTDIAFDAAGALLGAIPVVGSALSFLTDVASTGYGAYQDAEALQQSITNQVNKANEAAKAYSNADWGTIKVSDPRDVIVINDFKVGIDSILLPSLHDANNPGNSRFYQIDDAFGDGKQGVYISILQQNSLEPLQKVVFIANNYRAPFSQSGAYELDHTAFLDLIGDLLVGSQIGKFNTTPQYGDNNASNENLSGSFANDVIHAMGGNDEVFGYYGDDVLFGDAGDDTLYGGSNQNSAWLKYEQTTSNLNAPYLNDGNDFISGGEGNDILYGESGDDFIDGDGYKIQDIAGQKVRVAIGNGNDTLYGGTGYDTLQGGAGDDLLVDIDAKVSGGDGVDTVIADYSQMNYKGFGISLDSNSGSTITERDNDGVLLQFDGIEKLIITGTNNIDYLFGGASLDILNGGGGNDLLQGGLGNDALNGGIGGDDMEGGEGNDSYTVDSISDTVNEVSGGGTDFVKASVDFTLGDFLENLTLTGLALNGIGNGLNNVLKGNDNANILTGLLGSDTLNGNAGNDSLLGGNGYDILNGGLGKDSLNGGAGRDKFVFNTKLAAGNIDTIIGYKVADDAIVLENAIFKKFTGQNSVNAANFVANATGVAKDANDYLIYNTTNGKLFYDADGNGGGLAIEFADLDIVGSYFPALNAAEFAIV